MDSEPGTPFEFYLGSLLAVGPERLLDLFGSQFPHP